MEKLWKLDILLYWSEQLITQSKQDAEAIQQLEEKTTRVKVNGVGQYATSLSVSVRGADTLSLFKSRIKTFLFDKAYS